MTATESETTPESEELPAARPPFLKRVWIRNYKSIAFCDVSLEPLTVLVGRNASGKSNFLDALRFLSDLVDARVSDAVTRRGGWSSILHRNSESKTIEMGFEGQLCGYSPEWNIEYSFQLGESDSKTAVVLREHLVLNRFGSDETIGFRNEGRVLRWLGDESLNKYPFPHLGFANERPGDSKAVVPGSIFRDPASDRLLLSILGLQPFVEVAEELRASHVHSFSARKIREYNAVNSPPDLAHDGVNLAKTLKVLRGLDSDSVENIGRYFRAIVPGMVSFREIIEKTSETIAFIFSTGKGKTLEFSSRSMSDGTLRVLAALVAVHQIYLPTNAVGFVGIEEPETSLHPAAMRALVSAFDEATLRQQIIITSHSPDLLDAEEIKPENVRVVQMIDGKTVIAPVDRAGTEIVRRGLSTLGQLERENRLEPDEFDLERQADLEKGTGVAR